MTKLQFTLLLFILTCILEPRPAGQKGRNFFTLALKFPSLKNGLIKLLE